MRIKICGVTNREDALALHGVPIDYVGLNFVPASIRCLSEPDAENVRTACPPNTNVIGVFAHQSAEFIAETTRRFALDGIQLHDDSQPEFWPRIDERLDQEPLQWRPGSSARPILRLKAFRWQGDQTLQEMRSYLAECAARSVPLHGVVVDAYHPTSLGGTGATWDWGSIVANTIDCPIFLAGGLRPENVADAIRVCHPFAVDVASGVESTPGRKDRVLVKRFVDAARFNDPLPSR